MKAARQKLPCGFFDEIGGRLTVRPQGKERSS